eukprot:GHVR01147615.1.p4 GENE.GHVR01147615.1~~GHVR01147615.1.p4  ORF type:complete len:109 (-),score=29.86 GHVR01147615.1:166-492(-)
MLIPSIDAPTNDRSEGIPSCCMEDGDDNTTTSRDPTATLDISSLTLLNSNSSTIDRQSYNRVVTPPLGDLFTNDCLAALEWSGLSLLLPVTALIKLHSVCVCVYVMCV